MRIKYRELEERGVGCPAAGRAMMGSQQFHRSHARRCPAATAGKGRVWEGQEEPCRDQGRAGEAVKPSAWGTAAHREAVSHRL